MNFETSPLPPRLYRTARSPDGLFLTDWAILKRAERGRWDDTADEYRVLYCADSIVTTFVEVLADLRPNADAARALADVEGDDESGNDVSAIVRSRLQSRWTTTLIPGDPGDRVANVVAAQSRSYVEHKLPGLLAELGIGKLKIGDFIGHDRNLSRAVSRIAYDDQHIGVAAPSAEQEESRTYAFFEARPVSMQFRAHLIVQSVELAIQLSAEATTAANYLGLASSVKR